MIWHGLHSKSCVSKITMSPRAEHFVKCFSQWHLIHFKLNLIVPWKHSVFNITHQEINFRSRFINEMPKAILIAPSLRPYANFALHHISLCFPIYVLFSLMDSEFLEDMGLWDDSLPFSLSPLFFFLHIFMPHTGTPPI